MKPIVLGDARLLRAVFCKDERVYLSGFSRGGRKLLIELEDSGILKKSRIGAKSWVMQSQSSEGFFAYIKTYFGIDDFDMYIFALELEAPSRNELATLGVSTKLRKTSPKTGAHINAPYPLKILIDGNEVEVSLPIGTALFIHIDSTLTVPEDVVIVGVENFTNLTHASLQQHLFGNYDNVLFVERSKTLQNLLSVVPNQYLHYGDIDLAGINIYQTEYLPIVKERGKFFLPCVTKDLFSRYKGVNEVFEKQKNRFSNIIGENEALQAIIDAIIDAKKGIEQESFIKVHPQ